MDGWINAGSNEEMDGLNGRIEWMYRWMDRGLDGWGMDEGLNQWIFRLIDEEMKRWMNGIKGWMDGWMDE